MLKKILTLIVLMVALAIPAIPPLALADAKSDIQCGVNSAASGDCNSTPNSDLNSTITTIINILSAAVGIVAVIMIIIAGLRFVTSSGNPESAKAARNTITYAAIGLIVVAFAQIIVHFVLHTATTPPTSSSSSNSSSGTNCANGQPVC